jgi:hypothetical protein
LLNRELALAFGQSALFLRNTTFCDRYSTLPIGESGKAESQYQPRR